MHIVHVSSFFLPYFGGIEYYIYYIGRELVKRGHSVTVYASGFPQYPREENLDGIRVKRLKPWFSISGYPIMPSLLYRLIKEKKVDIMHAHINAPLVAETAALAALKNKTPLILTYHQGRLVAEDVSQGSIRRAKILGFFYDQLLSDFALRVAKKVILVSPLVLHFSPVVRRFLHKTVVIPDGVDTEIFSFEKRNGNLSDEKVILFVGRFVPFKGIDTLIDAFKIVVDKGFKTKLLLVGQGPLKKKLMKKVEELKITHRVTFLDEVKSHKELAKVYQSSDIMVLPSRSSSEGFGIVMLEAMACGLPVVASNVGGIPYVLGYGKYGMLFPPSNPYTLAKELINLLENEERLKHLREIARKRSLEFNWKKITDAIENLYEEVLA